MKGEGSRGEEVRGKEVGGERKGEGEEGGRDHYLLFRLCCVGSYNN